MNNYSKTIVLIIGLSLFVPFTILSAPAHASEHEMNYDTAGKVKVDKDISNTYNMRKVSAGFIFENTETTIKPILSVKMVNDIGVCLDGYSCKLSFTFGKNYAGISTHLVLTDIFEISVGPSVGYNTNKSNSSVGVSFLMVKF